MLNQVVQQTKIQKNIAKMPAKSKRRMHLAAVGQLNSNLLLRKREENELKERQRLQWQEKQQTHKSCMTFMATDRLQNIINHFSCPGSESDFVPNICVKILFLFPKSI